MSTCNKTPSVICIKEYDTVAISCEYLQDDGTPINLNDIKITADLKPQSSGSFYMMSVDRVDAAQGRFVLSPNTERLDVGAYQIDVLFERISTERRVSSDTFILQVNAAVTTPR